MVRCRASATAALTGRGLPHVLNVALNPFVGIAFRLQEDLQTYDAFYVRPTNGRADDQERRNHSNRAQTRGAAWHCGLNQEPWLTAGI
jgi:hypothetical protein